METINNIINFIISNWIVATILFVAIIWFIIEMKNEQYLNELGNGNRHFSGDTKASEWTSEQNFPIK